MNKMNDYLALPKLTREQKQKYTMARKKWLEKKKKADPGWVVERNERLKETRKIGKEECRFMRTQKQMTLPRQPLSEEGKLAYKKDVTDMVTSKMVGFGGTNLQETLDKLSSFGKAALDKTSVADGVNAEDEGEIVEAVDDMEEEVLEKEPKMVTDHAYQRSFDRGVTYDQVVETLTYGEDQGNDKEYHPGTHKLATKEVTLVVDDLETESIVTVWPNEHERKWKRASRPPSPCLRVKDGESVEQAEERMAKEIKAMDFWQKGEIFSRILPKLKDMEESNRFLKEDLASECRRNERLEEQLEQQERSDHRTMQRRIEELELKLACEQHANGYLQSQLDMATEFLSDTSRETDVPAKKRKRVSHY